MRMFYILAGSWLLAFSMGSGVALAELPVSPHDAPPTGFQKVSGINLGQFRVNGEIQETIRSTNNLLQDAQSIDDTVSLTTLDLDLAGKLDDFIITAAAKAIFEKPLGRDDREARETDYWLQGQYYFNNDFNIAARHEIDDDEVEASLAGQINGFTNTTVLTESYIIRSDYSAGPYYTIFTGSWVDVDASFDVESAFFARLSNLDRVETTLANETGRKVGGINLYVKLMASQIDYRGTSDAVPQDRNSDGGAIAFGTRRLFGPVRAEIEAGYLKRRFDASAIGDYGKFLGHVDLRWPLDNSNSVHFKVQRLFLETSIVNSPGLFGTETTATYRHIFQPGLYADIALIRDQIDTVGVRNDITSFAIEGEIHYAVADALSLRLSGSHAEKEADLSSLDIEETRFEFSLHYAF